MKKKIRFALIGCGRISYKHIEAISEIYKDAELVALCDVIIKRAKDKSKEYNEYLAKKNVKLQSDQKPRIYTDIDKMLEDETLDVLSICTPSGLHPEHGIKAAKSGIHVISEKPMATNLNLANKLIKTCDEAPVRLFVVKQNRLNPTMKLLKRAVEKRRFGKIYMILVNVLWTRPQSYYDKASWRGTWKFDGGAFMNQASHYIDAMEWLGGPVESVMATTATMSRNIEAEDTGSAVFNFKSGAIGNINVTMLTYPKNFEGSITIIGEKGTGKIGGVAINRVERWEFFKAYRKDRYVEQSSYEPDNIYGSGHIEYYKNVIEVLKRGAKPNTDGREGRKSLELALAIYKSSREKRAIRLG